MHLMEPYMGEVQLKAHRCVFLQVFEELDPRDDPLWHAFLLDSALKRMGAIDAILQGAATLAFSGSSDPSARKLRGLFFECVELTIL